MSRDKFEAWLDSDDGFSARHKDYDEFARAAFLAGRESMRDEAATIAEKHEEGPGGSEAIRNIEL